MTIDIFDDANIDNSGVRFTHHEQVDDPEDVADDQARDQALQQPLEESAIEAAAAKRPDQGVSEFNEPFVNRPRRQSYDVPGAWVHPAVRQRRLAAQRLPRGGQIQGLQSRISAVMRFGSAPDPVIEAEKAARAALDQAREVWDDAVNPEHSGYAKSVQHKDAVTRALAVATQAVSALERTAEEHSAEHFDSIVTSLDELRKKAARDLKAASSSYSEWRQAIAAAEALAQHTGRWAPGWHTSPDASDIKPLALVGAIRKARDVTNSDDDFINGSYLTTEYPEGQVPPHTMAALRKRAELAGPDSWAAFELARLVSPHPADGPAKSALALKDLRILATEPVPDALQRKPLQD